MANTTPTKNGYHSQAQSLLSPALNLPQSHAAHTLRRYWWRSVLGIIGPILLLALYSYICFYYLARPAQNDVVPESLSDARGLFYGWFIVSIFTLDWARTALANFQAIVLMYPSCAPGTAMGLLWHADDNWANPLWWLRAMRNMILGRALRKTLTSPRSRLYTSTPGYLWWLLSLISMLIFLAIPLSGLTIELDSVTAPSSRKAPILGPRDDTFNMKGMVNLPTIVFGSWIAGGSTTPSDASIFYAPPGTDNASSTYFEDSIQDQSLQNVVTFLGPAIDHIVVGKAQGIEATLSCSQVATHDLHLIHPLTWGKYNLTSLGSFTWLYLNETGIFFKKNAYSIMIAADGAWFGSTPYTTISNHDGATLDGTHTQTNSLGEPFDSSVLKRQTEGLLEVFLSQGLNPDFDDGIMREMFQDDSNLFEKSTMEWNATTDIDVISFSIQCRVKSAFGEAEISPRDRTYGAFRALNVSGTGTDEEVYSPQIQAVRAFGGWEGYPSRSMTFVDPTYYDSRWMSLHLAIGAPASVVCDDYPCTWGFTPPYAKYAYQTLSPENITLAMYSKLLGQSMIAMMGAGSQEPWEGDLFLLETTRWLRPGPVPWKPVLAILTLWTVVIVSLSTYSLFTRRWASTLNGFEFFRFGAQYTNEVSRFDAQRFEACAALQDIPGLVGVLPGGVQGGDAGFIGLSESRADVKGLYTYDRTKAARHRV